MAKFVIAGKCNCPYYAKAELVGDQLTRNLPNFQVFKITKSGKEWDEWLKEVCKKNSWKHNKSPIVWRETLDRGGKGMYIGDANDFQEYAREYYGVQSGLTSFDLRQIGSENENTHKILEEELKEQLARIKPFVITISHAASPVTYHIVPQILSGNAFDIEAVNDIKLKLYEKSSDRNALEGVKMEIEDLSSDLLRKVEIVSEEEEAFSDSDLIIVLDELENLNYAAHELKAPIIAKHYNPYIHLARSIDKYAKESCKIILSPFEFRAQIFGLTTIFIKNMHRLNGKENVIGNSLYEEYMAKGVLARRLKISPYSIRDVVVIGESLQGAHYIDVAQGIVTGYDGAIWARPNTHWRKMVELIGDAEWLQKEFSMLTDTREKTVKDALKRDGILAFSQSLIKLVQLWLDVNNGDDMLHSVVIYGHGHYNIRDDSCISLPVIFKSGKFHLNTHFKVNNEVVKIMNDIIKENQKHLIEKFQGDVYNEVDPYAATPRETPTNENISKETQAEPVTQEDRKSGEPAQYMDNNIPERIQIQDEQIIMQQNIDDIIDSNEGAEPRGEE